MVIIVYSIINGGFLPDIVILLLLTQSTIHWGIRLLNAMKRSILQLIFPPKRYDNFGVYVVIPFILDARREDAPAGVAQDEGHTGFLHLPSAVWKRTRKWRSM